jgi:hypothetical protein
MSDVDELFAKARAISKGAAAPAVALGREAAMNRKLARAYRGFAEQAAKNPDTAWRTNTYWQTAADYGRRARDASGRFKAEAQRYRSGKALEMPQ